MPRTDRLSIRVGGITLTTISQDPALALTAGGAAGAFRVTGEEPDVTVRAAWGDPAVRPQGRKLFDSGSTWRLYSHAGSYCFRFFSGPAETVPYKEAIVERGFTSGSVVLNRARHLRGSAVYPLAYPLDELLVTTYLSRGAGVEVHACGVADAEGRGYLFLGASGAGKTTMARLWQEAGGVEILSDDRIILRRVGTTYRMYGTPWHGEGRLASPAQARLARVYFLEHGDSNELRSLGISDAVSRFLATSFPPFWSSDGIDFTLGFFEALARAVPSGELRFVPEPAVVTFVSERAV